VHVDCKIHARIGNKTDGGWDICLTPPFQLVQPCLVYSFGYMSFIVCRDVPDRDFHYPAGWW